MGVGCMINATQIGGDRFGFCSYGTLQREMPDCKYDRVTLRNFIYSVIGSTTFPYKYEAGINKIYEEYKDRIDYIEYEKYINEHINALLIGSSIETNLKLIGILEYMFSLLPEVPDNLKSTLDYIAMDTDAKRVGFELIEYVIWRFETYMDVFKALGDGTEGLEEFNRLQNKFKISVFKKAPKIESHDTLHLHTLMDIVFCKDIKLIKYALFGLLGYNGVAENGAFGSDYQFYYRKDGVNKGVADKLLKTFKPMSIMDLKIPYESMLYDAVENVYESLEVDREIIYNSVFTFFSTVGGYIPVSQKGLEKLIIVFQRMNNLASAYNLSVEFLNGIQNKKVILRNCLLSASTFFFNEDDIVAEAYTMYFKYAMLEFLYEKHLADISRHLTALKNNYSAMRDLRNMRKELESLQAELTGLRKDKAGLEKELSNRDIKQMHKEYYEIIKTLNNENEKLASELSKEKAKVAELTNVPVVNAVEEALEGVEPIDLKQYKVIIIGHQEAVSNVKAISDYFKSCSFLDGMNPNVDVTKNQMDEIDFVFLQYEFVLHKCTKYTDLARRCKKPILRLKGTNKDFWLAQIDEELRKLIKQ